MVVLCWNELAGKSVSFCHKLRFGCVDWMSSFSHANSANMGCLEQRPTTEHRSPDILRVVLGTDDQDHHRAHQVNHV